MQNSYRFAAIRGVQAGRAYYVITVPLRILANVFHFDDEELPVELRSQRTLNKTRIPAIARYISDHPTEYVLSALSASIDGEFEFEPAGPDALRSVGVLSVAMTASMVINDGQHRHAGVVEALRDRPHLGNETIAVTLFPDQGLARAQQMFVDLNQHGVKPARSLRLYYDGRNQSAQTARAVVTAIPLFRDMTDYARSNLPTGSRKLFAFSNLHSAIGTLLHGAGLPDSEDGVDTIVSFWNAVIAHMPDWQRAGRREVATAELRRDAVHAHGVALEALAVAGARLMIDHPDDWPDRLAGLERIDWSRTNAQLWEGRALLAGRINRSRTSVTMTADLISRELGA